MGLMIELITVAFTVLWLLVLAHVVVSWVLSPYHEIRRFLDRIVQPLLYPIRKFVPPIGGIDFSPMVLLIGLDLVRRVVVGLLVGLA